MTRMNLKNIPPTKPYFPKEDIRRIQHDVETILNSGMLTLGDFTRKFESEFAKICKVRHVVAVSSGTSALEIALRGIGLRRGDEVLVPTNTFGATAASVVYAGGKPVLTDIDAQTLCINVENVRRYLTSKTKAVMVVHIGGLICPDIRAIKELCEDHHLFLIEDAAHAHGTTIDKLPAGSIGDAGCFSFYPTKIMTTGEGGILTTNDENIAKTATVLRDQGKESFYSNRIVELGYNWRMTEISAAIGLHQLKRLPEFVKRRNEIAKYYGKRLSRIKGIKPLKTPSNILNNYYKYTAFLSPDVAKQNFVDELRRRGVKCGGEVYCPPLHMQPVYQRLLKAKAGDFPQAERACKHMVCLPMYTQISNDEAAYVMDMVEEVLARQK